MKFGSGFPLTAKDLVAEVDAINARGMRDLAFDAGDLKRELIEFGRSARFDRWRGPFLDAAFYGDSADTDEPDESDVIRAYDDFLLLFRFPDGTGVIDRFLRARPDLPPEEREMLRDWRDPVDGVFEIIGRNESNAEVILHNLIDDLTYRAYASAGPAAIRGLRKGDFVLLRLVSLAEGAWFISGIAHSIPKSHAREAAQIALEIAVATPESAFRNPDKVAQGWEMQRKERDAFVEFFGSDEVILKTAEAEERLTAYYLHVQQSAFTAQFGERGEAVEPDPELARRAARDNIPEGWEDVDTIGLVHDETDGMCVLCEYGMLHELFEDPGLAASKEHASTLRAYLNDDSINPSAITRLVAAHPDTADEVFRRALKKRGFTWAEHGESLLRKHKPWYYESDPLPSVTVIGDRLKALALR